MTILTLEGNNIKKGNKFLNFIKNASSKFYDFLSWKSYHNDEIGVDTRSQTERHLDKTWEMYQLEQENEKKEAEMMKN